MAATAARSAAVTARRLMRALVRASLATAAAEGWPYASLVLVAVDHDASPLLLLSDLAEHSKNIARDRRVSLLFDGTGGRDDPLTGPRVTVLGELATTDDHRLFSRFTERHPSAAAYAGFADFHLYRLAVQRAHLVAGFGRIEAIAGEALIYPASSALTAAEAEILRHMAADHADAVNLYANRILGFPGDDWRLTGIDPEGIDLRRGGRVERLDFEASVSDASAARAALVRLANLARQRP
jgi:putative heme iron utilization protein